MKSIKIFFSIFLVLSTLAYAKTNNLPHKKECKEVNINFKDLQVNDFVKLVSKVLNKNILLQNSISGNVDFVSTSTICTSDLPAILQSVLGAKGHILVDRGGFLEIVKSKDASRYNFPLVTNIGDGYIRMVTKMIHVKQVNVDMILKNIQLLSSESGTISTIRDTNSILVTDFPTNIRTIESVIKGIDTQGEMEVRFFKLQNAEVSYIQNALSNVIRNRFDPRISTDKVIVTSDNASNTVIAVGSNKNLLEVAKIIEKFDSQTAMPEVQTSVIFLKNTEAKDVLSVLNKVLATQIDKNAVVKTSAISENNTNSIVVTGTTEKIEIIKQILNELDKEQQQVYVKARIIEINKKLSQNIGVKYGLAGGKATSDGLYSLAMNMGGSILAIPESLKGFIDLDSIKTSLAFGASIDFLQNNNAANIVAEPSILCINNKESKIYVGDTESVVTSGTTSNNTTDLSRNTYKREDIGLTLKIKPRISEDGKVTIEAETIIEEALPDGSAGMPKTTKREVVTKAIVKNGESVIVGGLIKDKSSTSISKVPLLGDIPLLGRLFTSTMDNSATINIVIILTPYIIPTSDTLTNLRKKLLELDSLQNRYNQSFMKMLRDNSKRAVDYDFSKEDEQDLLMLKNMDKQSDLPSQSSDISPLREALKTHANKGK